MSDTLGVIQAICLYNQSPDGGLAQMMMAGTLREGANEENCLLWEAVSQAGSLPALSKL